MAPGPHTQLPLCCPCGDPELYRRGRCRVCRGCHARLHRLRAIDRWVPADLEELWAEQHPGAPRQLQLPGALFG